MDRMFKVLGFWALIIAIMFLAGGHHFQIPAILFFVQALLFYIFGAMKLTEKTYMYLFGGYMFISFIGMVWYANFMMKMPA
ncbi:hypothetical protein J2Z48_000528 [Croceifilum oryzae]|uniref:DUF2626 domain-containing protein n=2 Tax=Croceifilum oryzae TaxID=1553429 RepID=A0AAJ1TDF0_9BACL|nr:hypothetical protein [Croceifilum oryzae]